MKNRQLTARAVSSAKEPGYYGDGSGLYLQISDYGTRSWVFRFMLHGRSREMGLGSLNTFSLKEARERARAARQLLADGVDPIEARREKRGAERAATAARITFEDAAAQYVAAHGDAWRNARHRAQWLSSLAAHAFPTIGKLPVDTIDLPHVLKVLEPIWKTKTETASRVRARMELILAWATVRKYRRGDNPARWDGHLAAMLPSPQKLKKVKHLAAMPFDQLPAFMADLREKEGVSARALEFTILVGSRTGEVVFADWSEIKLKEATWTIPSERMKSGKEHVVPLSSRAIELLGSAGEGRIFGSLHSMSLLRFLQTMRPDLTVHGFRSTFRDWAGDRTNYARDVIEAALAHSLKDKTEKAYRRSSAIEKRRRLMEEWARYCEMPARVATVTPIRSAQ